MAQINKRPLLSLCIPIYNRLAYLERQLERLSEDKDLFDNQIQLIVSDNCSTEKLYPCCEKYQIKGLKMIYYRQDTNIGPDGNFEWCFHHADGKYVWLLGSDDIPVKGFLRKLVTYLVENDYGLVHLSMSKQKQELTEFKNPDDMVVAINYWITFISANIICTKSLDTVDLSDYKQSFMIQVPAYLNACCSSSRNAIIYQKHYFESDSDGANNGGYNLFQVFVTNLFEIYTSFLEKGLLSQEGFGKVIKIEYRDFLCGFIVDLLILKTNRNFSTKGAWKSLSRYYANKPYSYYYLIIAIIKRMAGRMRHIGKMFLGGKD